MDMSRHDYSTEHNAPSQISAAPQTSAQRMAERDRPYASVYRRHEVATVGPRNAVGLDIIGGRSLVPTKEVAATIGFRAKVLCAIAQGGETFWVVDASPYYAPTTEPFNDQCQPRYLVPSPRENAPKIYLGFHGLAVVQPRVAQSSQSRLGIQRLAFDQAGPPGRAHAIVGASDPAARLHFDLPQDYPDLGFMVVLNNDDDASRGYPEITVTNLSDAQTEVLRPAARLGQLIGRLVFAFGSE